jgi:hypothetical protein
MGRNLTTYTAGNTSGSKLTQEIHDLFVNTIRITGRISIASARCAIGISTARGWMAKGRAEESGPYRDFLDATERAKAEFSLLASKQLSRLALGGRVEMPAWDKDGNPVRDHREGCPGKPGTPCGCPLVMCETVLKPESKILMRQLDRILGTDPQVNGEMEMTPEVPVVPELSPEERRHKAVDFYNLVRSSLGILEDLGQPLSSTLRPFGIETTATTVDKFMPALQTETTATPVPAEPEPAKTKPPSVDEAF